MVAEADYRIKLPVFEGPLDLLLFLIRKNELDIYDIPIATVTRQYLEVIYAVKIPGASPGAFDKTSANQFEPHAIHTQSRSADQAEASFGVSDPQRMKELQVEVAGEFFVMAATLMEIKSRMLLPKHQQAVDPNAEEDDLDPRWELVHQLLQYKKFKEAAGNLGQMSLDAQNMLPRPAGSAFAPASERPLQHVDRIEIWNSFNLVLRRLAEKLVVGEIHAEQVTVADQMEYVLERIKTVKTFVFSALFPEKISLRRLVATFLAVLELTRLKKLRLEQNEAFTDILCIAVEENELETPANPSTVPALDEESKAPPQT